MSLSGFRIDLEEYLMCRQLFQLRLDNPELSSYFNAFS